MRALRLKLFNQPPPKIVIVTVLKAIESVDVQICTISENNSNVNGSLKSIVLHRVYHFIYDSNAFIYVIKL